MIVFFQTDFTPTVSGYSFISLFRFFLRFSSSSSSIPPPPPRAPAFSHLPLGFGLWELRWARPAANPRRLKGSEGWRCSVVAQLSLLDWLRPERRGQSPLILGVATAARPGARSLTSRPSLSSSTRSFFFTEFLFTYGRSVGLILAGLRRLSLPSCYWALSRFLFIGFTGLQWGFNGFRSQPSCTVIYLFLPFTFSSFFWLMFWFGRVCVGVFNCLKSVSPRFYKNLCFLWFY